jgi:hypothetical protein
MLAQGDGILLHRMVKLQGLKPTLQMVVQIPLSGL